jgi:imidazole glycerol-phosphate synthase subunit HisH
MSGNTLVGIVNYGTGNLGSLCRVITEIGASYEIVTQSDQINKVDKLILPGVGHFSPVCRTLDRSNLREAISAYAKAGNHLLGICLGFHLLCISSEESPIDTGLGLLPRHIIKIRVQDISKYKVPHMGWNNLFPPESLLIPEQGNLLNHDERSYYFSNSYGLPYQASLDGSCLLYNHELPWIGVMQYNNIHGVQFHPEKSRHHGKQLLNNLISI